MTSFSISLMATGLKGEPCVWRADTAHGFAHEHREWNGLRKELNGSSYNRIYEKRLEKIGAEYERYIELFEGRRKK